MVAELRVVVADDHPVYRGGLLAALGDVAGLVVVADVADGPAAVTAAVERAADVVLMDLSMPGGSGFDVLTPTVFWAGNFQLVAAILTLVLVFRGHRFAPAAAAAVGFASAIGFTAAHVLPHWSTFSDSFTGSDVASGVTGFSWFAALFEIGADVAFGWAGFRMLRARGYVASEPRSASLST